MLTDEARRAEALQEYYTVNDMIDRFDQRAIAIKSWSVTITGALFATSVVQEVPSLFLLPAGCALLFWYIEGLWKDFQRPLIGREKSLQRVLNGGMLDRCECVPPRHFDFSAEEIKAEQAKDDRNESAEGRLNRCDARYLKPFQYKYNGPQINTAIHAHIGRTDHTQLCKNDDCRNWRTVTVDGREPFSPAIRFRKRSRLSRLLPRTLRYINVMALYLVMIAVSLIGYIILIQRGG